MYFLFYKTKKSNQFSKKFYLKQPLFTLMTSTCIWKTSQKRVIYLYDENGKV